jgi:small subunit ribosomal protein S19
MKKGPYVDAVLYERVLTARERGDRTTFRVWNRACTIVPEFVGMYFEVHNGRQFMKVYVTEDMVGHKLGEFAPTRTFKSHTAKAAKA